MTSTTAIQTALTTAGIRRAFDFDLLDSLKGITSTEFARRLMGRWAFAVDAYINNAIHVKLRDFREERETGGQASWDNYQGFLAYMNEIASDEQAMSDMGLNVKSIAEEVQRLYAMRRAIHATLANLSSAGTEYEEPDIREFFLDPRPRRDDANTTAKLESLSREFATNDDGVIDVEAMEMHKENVRRKRVQEKAEELEWDRRRGALSAELFDFLLAQDADVDMDADYPFDQLPAEYQYKMLTATVERYIDGVLEHAATKDRKITASELTKWQIEARPLRKALKAAIAHDKFNSLRG